MGDVTERAPEKVAPLDEIPANVKGVFLTKNAYESLQTPEKYPVLNEVFNLLLTPDDDDQAPQWAKNIRDFAVLEDKPINRKYAHHIAELTKEDEETNEKPVMRVVEKRSSWFRSSYFAVPKTLAFWRAIFNGRWLSLLCPTPPPANLSDTTETIRRITQFVHERKGRNKRMNVIGGDLRHWFHQINAAPWMRKLFGLKGPDGTEYQWQSIPMGWSWSPLIAQCAAWSFLAYREGQQAPLLNMKAFESRRLPTWVEVMWNGKVVGIATVYYDNYLLIVDDDEAYDGIQKRLTHNARQLHVVIKEGSQFNLNTEQICDQGFPFLGIHFKGVAGQAHRTRKHSYATIASLQWWPAKIVEWRKRVGEMGPTITARQLGQIAGICVFGLMLNPRGFGASEGADVVVAAMRHLGTFVGREYRRWDYVWDREDVKRSLLEVWQKVSELEQKPFSDAHEADRQALQPTYAHLIFSDASKRGVGWIFASFDGVGNQAHYCRGRAVLTDEHIFILELRAALEALQEWCAGHEHDRATLIVDNCAVAFALKNQISSNHLANSLMRAAAVYMRQLEDVILIPGTSNPADCCSRNDPDDWTKPGGNAESHRDLHERIRLGTTCVTYRQQGWNWADESAVLFNERRMNERTRHRESTSNDDSDADVIDDEFDRALFSIDAERN
eukprot:CAMPEP_0174863574 /NCGR_PEP_ID=MMETSP1114-20130205/56479_1 /TAXON_ID=312471 /ORGANISM="Neobodo designis, Strain CCAP 1951/1" /LENGTH=669 /DNA_ID=CAMNT_0016098645 /DNA_START=90 /DNA_END=2102 /DNA_ORIENTATION=+